jgi:hypothetical protein
LKHGGWIVAAEVKERQETAGDRHQDTHRADGEGPEKIRDQRQLLRILIEKQRGNDVDRPHGQQPAEQSARGGDEHAVREQPPGELTAPRAERDADRRLVGSCRRARQQERRNVDARNEEHDTRRAVQKRRDSRHSAGRFRSEAGIRKHGNCVGATPRRVHDCLHLID